MLVFETHHFRTLCFWPEVTVQVALEVSLPPNPFGAMALKAVRVVAAGALVLAVDAVCYIQHAPP